MPASTKDTARLLHAAYEENALFPESLQDTLNIDDAYDAQFELLNLREDAGETLVGWKVGLTSVAMQRQQGVHEPCLGHLLASGHRTAPASFAFDELRAPGFENELCLRLDTPLQGAEITLDDVAAAVGAVAPALEIIEKRSPFGADFPLAIAGNAQQHAFVTGAFVPYAPDMDLATVEATIRVNNEVAETATGAEVLGTPLQSIRWLSGKLAQFGRRLEAGTLVMSGSFTKQYAIAKGDHLETAFDGIGAAAAGFIPSCTNNDP